MNNEQLQSAVDQAVCQAVRLRIIQEPSAVQFKPGDRVSGFDVIARDGSSVHIAGATVEARHIDAVMLCKASYPGFAIAVSAFRCAPPEDGTATYEVAGAEVPIESV